MPFIEDKAGFSILKFFLQVYLPSVPWLCPTNHKQYKAQRQNRDVFLFRCYLSNK